MKAMSIRLPDDLAQRLAQEAESRLMSQNTIVLLALEEYLNRKECLNRKERKERAS